MTDFPPETLPVKQYSEACDENKDPILAVLRREFADCRTVLEIGSGTGQHAVYFSRHLPHLTWQPTDLEAQHASIDAWRREAALPNLLPPLPLNVSREDWPPCRVDGVFSANTTHIMAWSSVVAMFAGTARLLKASGIFCLYGPFNYNRCYTSDSNARFDAWLKRRDPQSGLRDVGDLDALAGANGLCLTRDYAMPVNNRLLVWRASSA
jgi:cyclopropane fatty-acyl-phospholipid synthase-like methyltransferase